MRNQFRLIFLLAVFAIGQCAEAKKSVDIHQQNIGELIVEQISDELSEMRLDSLANTPIIIAPEVTYNDYGQKAERNIQKFVIAILGLTMPFLFAFSLVWVILWYKKKRLYEKSRIIDNAIKNNYQLPDSFYSEKTIYPAMPIVGSGGEKRTVILPPPRRTQSALIWIAFGLTGVIFFLVVHAAPMAVLCLLAVFIGVAKLASVFLSRYSYRNDNEFRND